MRFKVETITPDKARKLLDQNDRLDRPRRTIRAARVQKLAHAITSGQWLTTHQGIAIGPDGTILDGNHRLLAIVAADQAVEVVVARDADPSWFPVLDAGAARTTGDSLKVAGFANTNILAATVRGWLAYSEIVGTTERFTTHHNRLTTADVIEFLDDPGNRDTAVAALTIAHRIGQGVGRFGVRSAVGISVLATRLLKNEVGSSTATEFYLRFGDGISLDASSPILALRRWFISDTGYASVSNELRRPVSVAVTLKALNAYALGQDRKVVAFRHGVESYPAPLPPGSRVEWEHELEGRERRAER